MAWLLIIYILPLVGIIAYLAVGELHLGKRRAERARAMWPSTAKWLNDLKACKHIFAEENSSVAAPLFKLCERRQVDRWGQRESATTDDRSQMM